jgi:beta-glucanase (GH16 family)
MQAIKILLVLCLFMVSASVTLADAPTPPAQAAGYSLVFYDDFSNLSLSPTGGDQYAWYPGIFYESVPSPFNATIANSVLDLKWTNNQNPSDTTISSCSSSGDHCRAFRYGYFEARMKWDVTTGAWPAFWMIPVEGIWGTTFETGELDIFEGQGAPATAHTFYGTVHDWIRTSGASVQVASNLGSNTAVIGGVDFSQWHNYGMLWAPGKVTWYFDDSPLFSAATYPIFDEQNYYLMLGAQEGVNFTNGDMRGVTASSMNLYVDWVKAWQLNQPLGANSNMKDIIVARPTRVEVTTKPKAPALLSPSRVEAEGAAKTNRLLRRSDQ